MIAIQKQNGQYWGRAFGIQLVNEELFGCLVEIPASCGSVFQYGHSLKGGIVGSVSCGNPAESRLQESELLPEK